VDEGSGRPVILLHGNPGWSFHFRSLIAGLRDDCRAIAMDYVGMGLSDKPDDSRYPYHLASRIDDLAALIDHLGLDGDLTLVMHDWGGLIGMGYASRWPERVARLVLLNTAAFPVPEGMKVPLRFRLVRGTALGAWLVRHTSVFTATAARVCCTRRRLPREVRDAYAAPYDSADNRIGILRFVQDAPITARDRSYPLLTGMEARLPLFRRTPALICWGDRDFVFTPRVLEVWQRHWPHAEVHRFPDCGHYLLEDAPDEVLGLVRSFLRRH
jgi:haloalkane dehalogenase